MGRRHGSNSTNGMIYTYHEKEKDKRESGWGSKSARLGKDSVKSFDCCCLTLQPCKEPVVTPDGFLYDKMAILEYMVHQKREIARKLKEYDKQLQKTKEQQNLKDNEVQIKEKKLFLATESSIKTQIEDPSKGESSRSLSNMTDGREKKMPSFWLPNETPDNKETKIQKPDEKVRCPMSGKTITMKDLIPVRFTEVKDDDDKRSLILKDNARYMCPITQDLLSNSVPCAVLRDTGDVVSMECVEKLIRPDMLNPITGNKLTDRDIICLQRGASGFSGSGIELKAKKAGAAMQVA